MTKNQAIQMVVDGAQMTCTEGQTVAGALLEQGYYRIRVSPVAGTPRGAFCMMGTCQECAIEIDGVIRRACQTLVAPGMKVVLHGSGGLVSSGVST